MPSEPPESMIEGSFGLDLSSAYYRRGIIQENQGIILQPSIELGVPVHESDGTLREMDLSFGLWNSLHEGPTGSGGPSPMWYESDFYIDLEGGLQPSAVLAFELDRQADGGADTGIYLQLGIAPSLSLGESEDLDLTLTVPVTLGLSLKDYYEDSTGDDSFFGYLDVGGDLTSPLHFMPSRMGPWVGHVGLHARSSSRGADS